MNVCQFPYLYVLQVCKNDPFVYYPYNPWWLVFIWTWLIQSAIIREIPQELMEMIITSAQ